MTEAARIDENSEFKKLFATVPKDLETGLVTLEDVFGMMCDIVGADLLTRERFDAARKLHFENTPLFSYEDCERLFLDLDHYLEHMPVDIRRPTRGNAVTRSISRTFKRIMSKSKREKEKQTANSESKVTSVPTVPEPQTPPNTHDEDIHNRLNAIESLLMEIVETQKNILAKLN